VQRKSSESIQYQCVWTILAYDKSLYIYVWVSLFRLHFSLSLFRSSHLTFLLFYFPLEGRTRSSSGANALPFSSSPRVYPHASSPLLSLSLHSLAILFIVFDDDEIIFFARIALPLITFVSVQTTEIVLQRVHHQLLHVRVQRLSVIRAQHGIHSRSADRINFRLDDVQVQILQHANNFRQ